MHGVSVQGGCVSEYGLIWEQIRLVRERLAAVLGVSSSDLHQLASSIRLVAEHKKRVDLLLALWAELEARSAKLDPDTDNQHG
jgi:hypothetical protein